MPAALQVRSRFDLLGGQIAEAEEQVMNRIDRLRLVPLVEVLQLHLHLGQHVRVEELTQLGLAEKLTKLGLIDRQRLRLPFGQRRVAVVDEIRHVAEEQRSGKGRRLLRVRHHDADVPLSHPPEQVDQRRDVEDIGQAFAVRLQNHGK